MQAIRHTGIVVSNLRKQLYFYRDLLGLKVVKEQKEPSKYIDRVCRVRNSRLTTIKMAAGDGNLVELLYFHSRSKRKPKKRQLRTVGMTHLAFTVRDLDFEYKRLLKAGIEFYSPPQVSPDGYAKVAFCRDYEYNPVELVEVL